MSLSYKELLGIDGEAVDFEWNIFPRLSTLQMQILQQIQDGLRERNVKPEEFTDRIIFMSMFNDFDWTRKGNDGISFSNSEKVKAYAKKFLEMKRNGMEFFLTHLKENEILQPLRWWDASKTQVIGYSRVSVLRVVGLLKKKNGRDTIHLSADASNTELLFQIIHSVNQLSIYGPVTN